MKISADDFAAELEVNVTSIKSRVRELYMKNKKLANTIFATNLKYYMKVDILYKNPLTAIVVHILS